jgi:hypothetical protein
MGIIIVKNIQELYNHNMMWTGFVKSTIATALISTGTVTTIIPFYSIQGQFPEHTPYVGIIMILAGVLIYYFGDRYNIGQNKKIEVLRLQRASDIVDQKIEQEKDRLAEEVLKKAEAKKTQIDIDVARQLRDIRDGICADLNQLANGDVDLEYCGTHKGNKQLEYVRYPDAIKASEIIQIGIDKFKARNEEISIKKLREYCTELYNLGLITKLKLAECIRIIEEG